MSDSAEQSEGTSPLNSAASKERDEEAGLLTSQESQTSASLPFVATASHENPSEVAPSKIKIDDGKLAATVSDETGAPLSKNALKRQRRLQHKMEVKKRRRLQVKEAKIVKAKIEGRDLDKERREAEERAKDGTGHAKREKLLMNRIRSSADKSFQVCVDCSFGDQMTYRENNSLAQQIRQCYATNKRSPNPVYLSITSLIETGTTRFVLEKVCGFPDQWEGRGITVNVDPMETVLDKSKLVYLTTDSPNELTELDNDKIYVIGGIVDRNRLKRATITRAEALSVGTAKLPISNHLKMFSTSVLTVNHVFEILLHKASGKDWKKSIEAALPQRKVTQELK